MAKVKAKREDAIRVHKTETVFFDTVNNCHYRLNSSNIVKVCFDYIEVKTLFGLKKELVERIYIFTNDPDIPEELVLCEHNEPNFRRYRGGFRSFLEDNRIPLEIYDVNGEIKS